MERARLLLVEDHALLTQTLTVTLQARGFVVVVPDNMTSEAVISAAEGDRPDVVLLDLDLGLDRSGVSLIGPLRKLGCEVVVVTGTEERKLLGECLEAGASGVFRKSEPFEDLVEAIEIAAGHGPVTPATAREQLLRELRETRSAARETLRPFERLTPREGEVLYLLTVGKSAERIADELVVTIATVRSQIRSILGKLGVKSQLEAVALAKSSAWQPK
jgi:two-component system, NarL family, nitrate/nitrite response regulator NarL